MAKTDLIVKVYKNSTTKATHDDFIIFQDNTLFLPAFVDCSYLLNTQALEYLKKQNIKYISSTDGNWFYEIKNGKTFTDIFEESKDKNNFIFQTTTTSDYVYDGVRCDARPFYTTKKNKMNSTKLFSSGKYYSTIIKVLGKIEERFTTNEIKDISGKQTLVISLDKRLVKQEQIVKEVEKLANNNVDTVTAIHIQDNEGKEVANIEYPASADTKEKREEYLQIIFNEIKTNGMKNIKRGQWSTAIKSANDVYTNYIDNQTKINGVLVDIGITEATAGTYLKNIILKNIIDNSGTANKDFVDRLKKIYKCATTEAEQKQIGINLQNDKYKEIFNNYLNGDFDSYDNNIEYAFLTNDLTNFENNFNAFGDDVLATTSDGSSMISLNTIYLKNQLSLDKSGGFPKIKITQNGTENEYLVFIKGKGNDIYTHLKSTKKKNFQEIYDAYLKDNNHDILLIPQANVRLNTSLEVEPLYQEIDSKNCLVLKNGKLGTLYTTQLSNTQLLLNKAKIYNHSKMVNTISDKLTSGEIKNEQLELDDTTNSVKIKIGDLYFYLYKKDASNKYIAFHSVEDVTQLETLTECILVPTDISTPDKIFSPTVYVSIDNCEKKAKGEILWKNVKWTYKEYSDIKISMSSSISQHTVTQEAEDDKTGQYIYMSDLSSREKKKYEIFYSNDSTSKTVEYYRAQDISEVSTDSSKYILSQYSVADQKTHYYKFIGNPDLSIGQNIQLQEIDESTLKDYKIYDTPLVNRQLYFCTMKDLVIFNNTETVEIKLAGQSCEIYRHDGYGNICPVKKTAGTTFILSKEAQYVVFDVNTNRWLEVRSNNITGYKIINTKKPIFTPKTKIGYFNEKYLFDYVKIKKDGSKNVLQIDLNSIKKNGIRFGELTLYIKKLSNQVTLNSINIRVGKNTYTFDENSLFVTDKNTVVDSTIQLIQKTEKIGLENIEKYCTIDSNNLNIDFKQLIPSNITDSQEIQANILNILQCIKNTNQLKAIKTITFTNLKGEKVFVKVDSTPNFESDKIKIAYLMDNIDKVCQIYANELSSCQSTVNNMQSSINNCLEDSNVRIKYYTSPTEYIYISQDLFNRSATLREEVSKTYHTLEMPSFETILANNQNISDNDIKNTINKISSLSLPQETKKYLIENISRYSFKALNEISTHINDITLKNNSLLGIQDEPESYLNLLQMYDFYLIQNKNTKKEVNLESFLKDENFTTLHYGNMKFTINQEMSKMKNKMLDILSQDIDGVIPFNKKSSEEVVNKILTQGDVDRIGIIYNFLENNKTALAGTLEAYQYNKLLQEEYAKSFLQFLENYYTQLPKIDRLTFDSIFPEAYKTQKINLSDKHELLLDINNIINSISNRYPTATDKMAEMKTRFEMVYDDIDKKKKEELEKRANNLISYINQLNTGMGGNKPYSSFSTEMQQILEEEYFKNKFSGKYNTLRESLIKDPAKAISENDMLYNLMMSRIHPKGHYNLQNEVKVNARFYANIFIDMMKYLDDNDDKSEDDAIKVVNDKINSYLDNIKACEYTLFFQLLDEDTDCKIQETLDMATIMHYVNSIQPSVAGGYNVNPLQFYIYKQFLLERIENIKTNGYISPDNDDDIKQTLENGAQGARDVYAALKDITFDDIEDKKSDDIKKQIVSIIQLLKKSGVSTADINVRLREITKGQSIDIKDISLCLHNMAINKILFDNIKGTKEGVFAIIQLKSDLEKDIEFYQTVQSNFRDFIDSKTDDLKEDIYKNILPVIFENVDNQSLDYQQGVLDFVKLVIKNGNIFNDLTKFLSESPYNIPEKKIESIIKTIELYLTSTIVPDVVQSHDKIENSEQIVTYINLSIRNIVDRQKNLIKGDKTAKKLCSRFKALDTVLKTIIQNNTESVEEDKNDNTIHIQKVFSAEEILNMPLKYFGKIVCLESLCNVDNTKEISKKILENTELLRAITKEPKLSVNDIKQFVTFLSQIKEITGGNSILFDKLDSLTTDDIRSISELSKLITDLNQSLFTYYDSKGEKVVDNELFKQFLSNIEDKIADNITNKKLSIKDAVKQENVIVNSEDSFKEIISKAILNCYAVERTILPENDRERFIQDNLSIDNLILSDMKTIVSRCNNIRKIITPKRGPKNFEDLRILSHIDENMLHKEQYSYQTTYRYLFPVGEKDNFFDYLTYSDNHSQNKFITDTLRLYKNAIKDYIDYKKNGMDPINVVALMFDIFSDDKDQNFNTANKNFWNNGLVKVVNTITLSQTITPEEKALLIKKLFKLINICIDNAHTEQEVATNIKKIADVLNDSYDNFQIDELSYRYANYLSDYEDSKDNPAAVYKLQDFVSRLSSDSYISIAKYAPFDTMANMISLKFGNIKLESQEQYHELSSILSFSDDAYLNIEKCNEGEDIANCIRKNRKAIAKYLCTQLIDNFENEDEMLQEFMICKFATYDNIYNIKENFVNMNTGMRENIKQAILDENGGNKFNIENFAGLERAIGLKFPAHPIDLHTLDIAMLPYVDSEQITKDISLQILNTIDLFVEEAHDDVEETYTLNNINSEGISVDITKTEGIEAIKEISSITHNTLFRDFNSNDSRHCKLLSDIIVVINDLKKADKGDELETYKTYIKNIFSNLSLDLVTNIRTYLVKEKYGEDADLDDTTITIEEAKEFIKKLNKYASELGDSLEPETVTEIDHLDCFAKKKLEIMEYIPYMQKYMGKKFVDYIINDQNTFNNEEDKAEYLLSCGKKCYILSQGPLNNYIAKEIFDLIINIDNDAEKNQEAKKIEKQTILKEFDQIMSNNMHNIFVKNLVDERGYPLTKSLANECLHLFNNNHDVLEKIVLDMYTTQENGIKNIKLSEFFTEFDKRIYNNKKGQIYDDIYLIFNNNDLRNLFKNNEDYLDHMGKHMVMINFNKKDNLNDKQIERISKILSYDLKQKELNDGEINFELTQDEKEFLKLVTSSKTEKKKVLKSINKDQVYEDAASRFAEIKNIGLYYNCLDNINNYLKVDSVPSDLTTLISNHALLGNETYKNYIFNNHDINDDSINIGTNIDLLKFMITNNCSEGIVSDLTYTAEKDYTKDLTILRWEFIYDFLEEKSKEEEKNFFDIMNTSEDKKELLATSESVSDLQKQVIKNSINICANMVLETLEDEDRKNLYKQKFQIIYNIIDRIKNENLLNDLYKALGNKELYMYEDSDMKVEKAEGLDELIENIGGKFQKYNAYSLMTLDEIKTIFNIETDNEVLQTATDKIVPFVENKSEIFYNKLIEHGFYDFIQNTSYKFLCNEATEVLKNIMPDDTLFNKMIDEFGWTEDQIDGLCDRIVELVKDIHELPDSNLKFYGCESISTILGKCMNEFQEVQNEDRYKFLYDVITSITELVQDKENGMSTLLNYSKAIEDCEGEHLHNSIYFLPYLSKMNIDPYFVKEKYISNELNMALRLENIYNMHEAFKAKRVSDDIFYSIASNIFINKDEDMKNLMKSYEIYLRLEEKLTNDENMSAEEKHKKEKYGLFVIKYLQNCIKFFDDEDQLTEEEKEDIKEIIYNRVQEAIDDDAKVSIIILALTNNLYKGDKKLPSCVKDIKYEELINITDDELEASLLFVQDFLYREIKPNIDEGNIFPAVLQKLLAEHDDFFNYEHEYTIDNPIKKELFINVLDNNNEENIDPNAIGEYTENLYTVLNNIDYDNINVTNNFRNLLAICNESFAKKQKLMEILNLNKENINKILENQNTYDNIYNCIHNEEIYNIYNANQLSLLFKILPGKHFNEYIDKLRMYNVQNFITTLANSNLNTNHIIEKLDISIDHTDGDIEVGIRNFQKLLIKKSLETALRKHPIKNVVDEGEPKELPYSLVIDDISNIINEFYEAQLDDILRMEYCNNIIQRLSDYTNINNDIEINYISFIRRELDIPETYIPDESLKEKFDNIPTIEQLGELEVNIPNNINTQQVELILGNNEINKYLLEKDNGGNINIKPTYLELFESVLRKQNNDQRKLSDLSYDEINQLTLQIQPVVSLIKNIEENEEIANKDGVIKNITKVLRNYNLEEQNKILNKINTQDFTKFDTYFVKNYNLGSYIANSLEEDNVDLDKYEKMNKCYATFVGDQIKLRDERDIFNNVFYDYYNLLMADNTEIFNSKRLLDIYAYENWEFEVINEYIESKLSNIHYSDGRPYKYKDLSIQRDELFLSSLNSYIQDIFNKQNEEKNFIKYVKEKADIFGECSNFDELIIKLQDESGITFSLNSNKYTDYEQIFTEDTAKNLYLNQMMSRQSYDDINNTRLLYNVLLDTFDSCIDKNNQQILPEFLDLVKLILPIEEEVEEQAVEQECETIISNIIENIKNSKEPEKVMSVFKEYFESSSNKNNRMETLLLLKDISKNQDKFESIFSNELNMEILLERPEFRDALNIAIDLDLNDKFKRSIFFDQELKDKDINKTFHFLENGINTLEDDSKISPLKDYIKEVKSFDELKTKVINEISPNIFDEYICIPVNDGTDNHKSFDSKGENKEEFNKIKEKISEKINTLGDLIRYIEILSECENDGVLHYEVFNKSFANAFNVQMIDLGTKYNKKLISTGRYDTFEKDLKQRFISKMLYEGDILGKKDALEKPNPLFALGLMNTIYDSISTSKTTWNTQIFGDFLKEIIPLNEENYDIDKWQKEKQVAVSKAIIDIFEDKNAEKILKVLSKDYKNRNTIRIKNKKTREKKSLDPIQNIIDIANNNCINIISEYADQLDNDNVNFAAIEAGKISILKQYKVKDDIIKSFYPQDKDEFKNKHEQLENILFLEEIIEKNTNISTKFRTFDVSKCNDAQSIITGMNDAIFNAVCDKVVSRNGEAILKSKEYTKAIKDGLTSLIDKAIEHDKDNKGDRVRETIYNKLAEYAQSSEKIDFNTFETEMLQIANDKLENENKLIFELTYSQGIALRGEDEGKKVVAKKLAQDLYSDSTDPDKEVQQGKAEEIIKILFDDVIEGNIDNKKIKDIFKPYIKAIIPVNDKYTTEEQDKIKNLTSKIKDLESHTEYKNIIEGIANTLSSYKGHDDKVEFITDLNDIIEGKGTDICTIFANDNNVEIIQNYTDYKFISLEDTCVVCKMMDKYVSDKLRDEIIKSDTASIENRNKIINVCSKIENNEIEYGVYLDTAAIKACETVDDFEKCVKDAKIKYFIGQVTDKDDNKIESTHDGYKKLLDELNKYEEEDLDKLLKTTRDLRAEVPSVTNISKVLSRAEFYPEISYDVASKLFSEEYIEESLVVHISEDILKDLGKTGDRKVQNNLINILTSGKEKLLDKEKGQINDDYEDLIKIISNKDVEIGKDCSENLATLINKVDSLSNKKDVIESITEILKDEDNKLPKLVEKLSKIEDKDIESMISKSSKIFTKLIKEDEVTAEQVKSTIEAAEKLDIKTQLEKDIDKTHVEQIQTISKAVEIIDKSNIKIDLSAEKTSADCIVAYRKAIFDTMAKCILSKSNDESTTIFNLETTDNKNYQEISNKFWENIINNEEKLKIIKKETENFTKKVPFKKLLKQTNTLRNIGRTIIKQVTGEDIKFDEILEDCTELNWTSKGIEVQQSIVKLCEQDSMKKLIDKDEMKFNDDKSQNTFVKLIQNIPEGQTEAKTYTEHVSKIVEEANTDMLKEVYGQDDSKPLTTENVSDLSENIKKVNELYTEDKVLTTHLMKKQEKKVEEIEETASNIHNVIGASNTKLMESICEEDKLDEIVTISKIETINSLGNLNQSIKAKFNTATTLDVKTKAEITKTIIDAQLAKLKTEDSSMLVDKDEVTVMKIFRDTILKNSSKVYEDIIKNPDKELGNTFGVLYMRFCGGGSVAVTEDTLRSVVLRDKDKENTLIMDNLKALTACVDNDLSIKKNSLLSLLQNFTKEDLDTLQTIECKPRGKKTKVNAYTVLQEAVKKMAESPNSLTDEYQKKLTLLLDKIQSYKKAGGSQTTIIDIIEFLSDDRNTYYTADQLDKIQDNDMFARSLKAGKKFSNAVLEETINTIASKTFNSWKSLNQEDRKTTFESFTNMVKILDETKYRESVQLLYNFADKKQNNSVFTDIANTGIVSGDSSETAYAKTLYSVIKNCDNQKEVGEILNGKEINAEQLKKLAEIVAQDKKPSQLALHILTTPKKEIAKLSNEIRKEIINTLTNSNSKIRPYTQYLLIHSLQSKEEYKDEEWKNLIHGKETDILKGDASLSQVRSIFSLSNTDILYNSIIDKRLDINSEIGINDSLSQSQAYALKLAELCNNDHNAIIKTYHDFLEKSNKSSIGDDKSSKEAIVNVIVSACQEDTKLFTEIMTGDTFTEENKVDLIKGKYLPQRLDCTVVETKKELQIFVNVENTVENILQDCERISKETTSPEDKVKNESIFVKGVNEALKYHNSDVIAQICDSIKDDIDIEKETPASLRIKGHLLCEISARQTEQFDLIKGWARDGNITIQRETRSKPILEEKANDEIISNLIDIDKKVYGDSTEKDGYIPSIYHFIETVQNSNIKEKQSKKIADKIISKLANGKIEVKDVLNILSGCKTADKEKKKSTYNAIIDGLASQAKDENTEQIQNVIKNCLSSENEEEKDIAVDLYYKISQRQSNNLQKNNFSESNLSKLLLETPLQTYIEQKKQEDYEIITGSLLVKKQGRNVEDILKKLNLSAEQIKVYKEQIALLSTPEEIFDLLNGLIKNHNTKIASGMAKGHMDLLTSGDRDTIKGEFEKHDLKGLFMGKSSKEKEKNKEKLYAELEERASRAGFTEKHEIRGLIKKLKRKEKEFDRARTELTKFADLHIKRAREAAEYIAKYNKYNEIINDKQKYGEKERKEARRARKTLAKGHYDFMNHAHGWGRYWRKKANPIQLIWSMFTYKSTRKFYYAKRELEKSNKALRVVIGVDFVPEYDSKKGTEYTIRTNVKPNPNATTIKSKKLRMIKQHEDAGFWSQLWGGGKARYSRVHELRIHRTGDATAMEGFTEKFIKETSDLRKEAVEILTKKNYYSKSSLGKVKTSDKENLNFIYDAGFDTSKDQENENKSKGGRSS